MTTATLTLPVSRRLPRLVGLAVKLCTRGPSLALREYRKRRLRVAYLSGTSHATTRAPEETDPALVETGKVLRQQLLASYENKYRALAYRVLMMRPVSLTAEIWFGDLDRCMNYLGIDCRTLPPDASTGEISAAFEEFGPNVFIATEAPQSLGAIDLLSLLQYKKQRGCLRMFVPVMHANSPRKSVPSGRSTQAQDEWRRQLHWNGLAADMHFSIFEPEFHERFTRDPKWPAVDYVTIPMAANPFVDYPVAATRLHDYFLAASMTDERVAVSYRYLRPILQRYRGLWAGPQWGFGMHSIPPAEMPRHYAESRIALSPLVGFVHHFAAELTHRVYASAACGAFQLTMRTPITDRFFEPQQLVCAASPEEYVRLFDHYVDRPHERNAVALAALRRTYSEHTCFHRIDKLVFHWNEWRRRSLF